MAIDKKIPPNWRGWSLGIAGGLLALILLGVGLSRLLNTNQGQSAQTASDTATPLPQRVEVAALGRLEPRGEVVRVSGPSGERIARLLVKQGDLVQAGSILAYLESFEERRAERDYAASQLAEAQAKLEATTDYGEAQIQAAERKVDQVQRPGDAQIAAQRARVREAQAQLELAQANLQRDRDLQAQGAISQRSLDERQTEVRQLEEQLRNAQASLVQLETRWQEDVRTAEADLEAQRANLPLSQVEVEANSARRNLDLAQARLERTVIHAPQTGRVLRIITREGEAIGTSAGEASRNDGILELGDTSQMFVVAEVYESDVGLVKLGQTATITSRNGAFETSLTGKVAEIGWQIFKNNVLDDDPAANADARIVEVKIQLDESKPVAALTNLQVDVRIDVKDQS
jgi:HlyD family secretion protein